MNYIFERIRATFQPFPVVGPVILLMAFSLSYSYVREGYGAISLAILSLGSLVHAYVFLGILKLVWTGVHAKWNKRAVNLIHFNFYAIWYPAMVMILFGMFLLGNFLDGRW